MNIVGAFRIQGLGLSGGCCRGLISLTRASHTHHPRWLPPPALCFYSHLLPQLGTYVSVSLPCLELPQLTEQNMPSANNAIWSLGELLLKVCWV